ncbi:MAG: trypsin-like serine protease, partial [bacterium]|nr:trypsin-like serine protease [bacterium]
MNWTKRINRITLGLVAVVGLTAALLSIAPVEAGQARPAIPELGALERNPTGAALPVSGTFAPVVERAAPAVVSVTTSSVVKLSDDRQGSPFFFGLPGQPPERRRRGAGSGVIISAEGYILTNHHVIEQAQEIDVTLSDKRVFAATVVGSDSRTDIAILKIDGDNLPVLPLGNSDNVRVGDIVLAIGNPFGIGKTVTMGIVGATGRGGLGIEDYEDFIQTDAAINPGNSGGALIDTKGELVGVNTAILSRSGGNQGVGFAVPINMGHDVLSQILENGEVRRGYLGVNIQNLTPAMAKAFDTPAIGGAVVNNVSGDSPAGEAGVERGDIITGVNG